MDTKQCTKCGLIKPLDEFTPDKRRKYGRGSHCRTCHNAQTAAFAKTDKGREIQRNYWLSDESRTKQRERAKRYRQKSETKIKTRERVQRNYTSDYARRKKQPQTAARWTINNAVRHGWLASAKDLLCAWCGNPAHEYHHYKGYEREHRLDVIPLCKECHGFTQRSE